MNSDDIRIQLGQAHIMQARQRSETLRWLLLVTLNVARPEGAEMNTLLLVMRAEYPDATALELRRELDYLASRDLISIHADHMGHTSYKLKRYGVDVQNYTVPCEPGIARPRPGL